MNRYLSLMRNQFRSATDIMSLRFTPRPHYCYGLCTVIITNLHYSWAFHYSETYTINFIRVLLSHKLLHLSLRQCIPTSTSTYPNSMHQKSPKRLRSSMIPLSKFWRVGLDGTRYPSSELDYRCLQILVNYLMSRLEQRNTESYAGMEKPLFPNQL